MQLSEKILEFWFGQSDLTSGLKPRKVWFKSSSSFDQKIYINFRHSHDDALAGRLDNMAENQKSCLALIILLDKFPRNLFRESPLAFRGDAKAQKLSYYAISQRFDEKIDSIAKLFFYLPLEHSENIDDQKQSLKLINAINGKRINKAATEHYNVIKRFGRFPHRNAVLGRKSTPEELIYLSKPPAW